MSDQDAVPPVYRFYEAQLANLPLDGGHFVWAPRGYGVHQALKEWSELHTGTDGVRLKALESFERATAPDDTAKTYFILLQIEADFSAILAQQAPAFFLDELRGRRTLVTANLPRYLVDTVSVRRLLPVDDPVKWTHDWSNWWDMYGWQETELQPWRHRNREGLMEWCKEKERALLGDAEQGGRALWPRALGVRPDIIRSAWGSVLGQAREDWTPDILKSVLRQAALNSPGVRSMAKAVSSLRADRQSGPALALLRELVAAAEAGESAKPDPDLCLRPEADQLHQLGLTYLDDTEVEQALRFTCPYFADRLRVMLRPTASPVTVVPPRADGWAFDAARYAGDALEGTLLLDGPDPLSVAVSGEQHVAFVRALVEAEAPVPLATLQARLGLDKPKNVINHVDRLRRSLNAVRKGVGKLVHRKSGAISLKLEGP